MNQDGDMDGLQVQVQLVKVRSRSAGGPSGLSSIPAALYFNCPPPSAAKSISAPLVYLYILSGSSSFHPTNRFHRLYSLNIYPLQVPTAWE